MSASTRKVIHYSIKIEDFKTGKELNAAIIDTCFKSISKLSKQERVYDAISVDRFHLLFSYVSDGKYAGGFFKSAKYNHRPDLIDKQNLQERQNPKKLTEGEGEKTHFAIGFNGNEALLLLESKRDGVLIGTFQLYLERFLERIDANYRINIGLSVRGDFKTKLKELEQVSAVEIFTPYTLVTDTFGEDLPISKDDIRDDAILTFKAKKRQSIKSLTNKIYEIFSHKQKDKISRIKVYGKTAIQSGVLLDTDKLKDHDNIKVELDDNKQVITDSILPVMRNMIREIL